MPLALEKVPVCLIVLDPNGPIGNPNPKGFVGGGKRYRVACGMTTPPKYQTDLVAVTSCPKCLKSDDYKEALKTQDLQRYMREYPDEFKDESGNP